MFQQAGLVFVFS